MPSITMWQYQITEVSGLMVPDGFTASFDNRLFVYVRRESGTDTPLFMYSSLDTDTDIAPKISGPWTYAQSILFAMEFFGAFADTGWKIT